MVKKLSDYPIYIPSVGWMLEDRRISEEEAERICKDAGIPFCIEEDAVETTFLLRTFIAGMQFVDGFERLTEGMGIGEQLELRRMPHNKQDSAAVSVLRRGSHIGYIPRDDNRAVASLMDSVHRIIATVSRLEHGRIEVDLSIISECRRVYRHFSAPFGMEYYASTVFMETCPSALTLPYQNGSIVDFDDEPIRMVYRRSFG